MGVEKLWNFVKDLKKEPEGLEPYNFDDYYETLRYAPDYILEKVVGVMKKNGLQSMPDPISVLQMCISDMQHDLSRVLNHTLAMTNDQSWNKKLLDTLIGENSRDKLFLVDSDQLKYAVESFKKSFQETQWPEHFNDLE